MKQDLQSYQNCGVCYELYDTATRVPFSLPQCRHTICKVCVHNIMDAPQPACSFDREKFPKAITNGGFVQPQINDCVLMLLQSNQGLQNRCATHNKALKYFCKTNYAKIYSRCILEAHRSHDFHSLEEVQKELNETRKSLKTFKQAFKDH